MNDMIINAAQDPSCILAVTPDRGGSWWAALRTDTPRNFAENAHTFYDCQAVVQEALDPTHDYSFLIEAEIVRENPECSVFYAGGDKFPFGVYVYGDNTIRVFSNLLRSASDTSSKYATVVAYSGDTRLQGRHTIELRIEGDAMRVFLDGNEIEHPYVFARTGSAAVGLPNCNSGYVYKIQIEDLTTGEIVWRASRDELYETNPWPSATLRNFDDVTAAWYDAVSVGYAAIGDHDCEFEISYKNNVDYPGTIFYSNSQAGSINLHQIKNNQNTFSSFRAFNETYPSLIIPLDAGVQNSGSHIVKFKRQNGTAEAWVDGQLVKSVTSDLGNKPLYAENVPASHFDGNIFYIRLTDLTTGRTVWSYPSEAERVRLLTKTNVRTDRGVFEAADTSKRWSVTTQLRAAALIPECTIIVEADNPGGEIVSYVSCAQLLNPSQGFFVIRKHDAGALLFGYSGKNSSGAMVYPNRYIEYPDGKHVFAFVLDYSALQLRIYIDGAEVDNRAMDVNVVAPPEFDETVKPVILGVTSTSDGLNLTSKISHCLIFDRALTAAEIAAFGVRRPRNFAEKTMTWTEFSPDKITINTQHDYEFLIQFSSNGQLPPTDSETQLFYSTDNKMLAGVWIAKDGQIRGYLSVYEYNALMIHEIGEPALSAGIHTIRILAVGNTMSAYLDDELMNSAVRNRRTDFSEITSYPISSFDGNLLCAKLTDLTTGENVWRANHNDLFTY